MASFRTQLQQDIDAARHLILERCDSLDAAPMIRPRRRHRDGSVVFDIVLLVRHADIAARIAADRAEACATKTYNPDTIVVDPPSPGAMLAAGKARFASVLRELDAEAASMPSDLRAALWDWLLEQAGERLVKAGGEP